MKSIKNIFSLAALGAGMAGMSASLLLLPAMSPTIKAPFNFELAGTDAALVLLSAWLLYKGYKGLKTVLKELDAPVSTFTLK